MLKKNRVRFKPFGDNGKLNCIGRSKVHLEAKAGAKIDSMVYVIKDVSECLLGKKDAERLGIVELRPEGKAESVRKLSQTLKETVPKDGQIVSGEMTQSQIDWEMESIVGEFKGLFNGNRKYLVNFSKRTNAGSSTYLMVQELK